jgi:hypothetical protein
MVRTQRIVLLASAAVIGGLLLGHAEAKPPKGGKKGDPAHDLRKAHETITQVSLILSRDREPAQTVQLLAHAKDFYRSAHQAFARGDIERARELAKAANDGARGIRHLLVAAAPAVDDLPLPDDGDFATGAADRAWRELDRARERYLMAESWQTTADGAQDFEQAGRQVYDEARDAYSAQKYERAAELARAAEAWAHVGEHVARADGPDARFDRDRRPPKDRRPPNDPRRPNDRLPPPRGERPAPPPLR